MVTYNASSREIKLSAELHDKVAKLVKTGASFADTLEQVIKLGCYQLDYRRERNVVQAEAMKVARQIIRERKEKANAKSAA